MTGNTLRKTLNNWSGNCAVNEGKEWLLLHGEDTEEQTDHVGSYQSRKDSLKLLVFPPMLSQSGYVVSGQSRIQ